MTKGKVTFHPIDISYDVSFEMSLEKLFSLYYFYIQFFGGTGPGAQIVQLGHVKLLLLAIWVCFYW